MELNICWSDSLESLAKELFRNASKREDPFETECTVVGSPVMEGWLKQYFLHDLPKNMKPNPVLANWEFKMIHPFVNDWLAKAHQGTEIGTRDPALHPYSVGVLQWRIWNELSEGKSAPREYVHLENYVESAGTDAVARDLKRWGLAARLAKLFDDYQNYRVDLLENWGGGGMKGPDNQALADPLRWQAVMWHNLVKAEPVTYLEQFKNMSAKLGKCGIGTVYKRVTIFHTSAIPKNYMAFFVALGEIVDTQMYIFNPSKDFWIEDESVRTHLQALREADKGSLDWMTPPHPVLSGFGRATQAFLATVIDATEGNISSEKWSEARNGSLLHKVQAHIREKQGVKIAGAEDDASIQFHVCHGPQREVEVAKDLVLKWFGEHPGSQPRDVQVLVPDMETYAPFIESVFQVNNHTPPIPCSLSKRPAVSAGAVGAAFVRLMKFSSSRMTAPEAMELLELDPVRERYGLEPEDLAGLRGMVDKAGIRWGRDGDHVKTVLDNKDDLPDTVTWRRGLDRLLAGFATGRCAEGDDVIDAGALGALCVCDGVEGGSSELLGKLGQFYQDLCEVADGTGGGIKRKVTAWADYFTEMVERFFRGTESSFGELAEIRRGIRAIRNSAGVAKDPEVGVEVMASAIEAQLGGMEPAGRSDINAVLFSPMRTMQVTPRKLIIMLGLNEGIFPRADQRAAFDLLAIRPRYGDRSMRYEDRLAFLEGLMSARERLIITYDGRNIANNKEVPPSPAVTEFRQYLDSFAGVDEKGAPKPLVVPVEHRLHGINPEYYREGSRLFSYSKSNYEAACMLAGQASSTKTDVGQATGQASVVAGDGHDSGTKPVTLEELQEFFANPARSFYTKVLQVRIPDPGQDNVPESEMFDGDTREEYNINRILLADLIKKSQSQAEADYTPDEAYYKRLQERALIPLGTFGRGGTQQGVEELKLCLNQKPVDSRSLYQLLRIQQEKGSGTAFAVNCGTCAVTGTLLFIPGEDSSLWPRFRYADIKPKDRVRAWVAHVAGHAAGYTFDTVIMGKDLETPEMLRPVEKPKALDILNRLVKLYDSGRQQTLAFEPVASYAYAVGRTQSGSEEGARRVAGGAWAAEFRKGYIDRYLVEAWGEDGPANEPDFGRFALDFWGEYTALADGAPAGESGTGEEDGDE